jgi:hypothetical protein
MSGLKCTICLSMILTSCTPSLRVSNEYHVTALGNFVSLRVVDAEPYRTELIDVTDTSLVHLYKGALYQVALSQLDGISVEGYAIGAPKYYQMLSLMAIDAVVGAVILSTPKEQTDQWITNTGYFFLLMVPVTAATYISSEPKTYFSCPLDAGAIRQLRLCSRYPQGLSIDQQQRLLAALGQDRILTMPPRASK